MQRGLAWQASFAIALVIVVALYVIGSVKGATATVTPKAMAAAMLAIHYPVPHPKTLACRGTGQSTFRCVATLTHHRRRVFYTAPVGVGGWMCAGRTPTGCAILKHGFYPASLIAGGWQEVAVKGWLQARNIDKAGAPALQCTGTTSPVTCVYPGTPQITVILTYTQAKGGFVESAIRG